VQPIMKAPHQNDMFLASGSGLTQCDSRCLKVSTQLLESGSGAGSETGCSTSTGVVTPFVDFLPKGHHQEDLETSEDLDISVLTSTALPQETSANALLVSTSPEPGSVSARGLVTSMRDAVRNIRDNKLRLG